MFENLLAVQKKLHRIDSPYGARFYEMEGIGKMPSVTSIESIISKPALVPWAKKEALKVIEKELREFSGKEISINDEWIDTLIKKSSQRPKVLMTEAADYGTECHRLINAVITKKITLNDIEEKYQHTISSYADWVKKNKIEIKLSEIMIYHPIYKYAGSLDCIASKEGNFILIDFKTSKGIWPEFGYQVAAYSKAVEALTDEKISEAWIVRFPKEQPKDSEPSFEVKKVADIDRCFDAFLAAKNLWEVQKSKIFVEDN